MDGLKGGVRPDDWLLCRSCRLLVGRSSCVDLAVRVAGLGSRGGREGCTEAGRRESLLLSVRSEKLLPREKMEEMRLAMMVVGDFEFED